MHRARISERISRLGEYLNTALDEGVWEAPDVVNAEEMAKIEIMKRKAEVAAGETMEAFFNRWRNQAAAREQNTQEPA